MADEKKVAKVKEAFGAWKVPTEQDFAELIELADVVPPVDRGLQMASDGQHAVKLITAPAGGLKAEKDHAWVECVSHGGLTAQHGPLEWVPGAGVTENSEHALKLHLANDEKGPLIDDADKGLHLDVGPGLTFTQEGALKLNVAPDGGLEVDPATHTLRVKCDPHGGLKIDEQGRLTIDLNQLLFPST